MLVTCVHTPLSSRSLSFNACRNKASFERIHSLPPPHPILATLYAWRGTGLLSPPCLLGGTAHSCTCNTPLPPPCSAKDDRLAAPREVLRGSLTTPEGVCTVDWSQGHAPGLQTWPFFRVDEHSSDHVCHSVKLPER